MQRLFCILFCLLLSVPVFASGWKAEFLAHKFGNTHQELTAQLGKQFGTTNFKMALREANDMQHYNIQLLGGTWGIKIQSGNYIEPARQSFSLDWLGKKVTTYATPTQRLIHAFIKQDFGRGAMQFDYIVRDSSITEWEFQAELEL